MKTLLFTVLLASITSLSFADAADCYLLRVDSITIDTSTNPNTLNVYIYNGDSVFINYPYVEYVIDNTTGDTIAEGFMSFFGQLPQSSQIYSVSTTLNEIPNGFFYAFQFSYAFPDTSCILSYNQDPLIDCGVLTVTDIHMDSANFLEITIFNADTAGLLVLPFIPYVVDNNTGDTLVYNDTLGLNTLPLEHFSNTSVTYSIYTPLTSIPSTVDWTIYLTYSIGWWVQGGGTCPLSYSFTTDISPLKRAENVQIFPNPANSTISFSGLENFNKIMIYDMLGNIHIIHQNLSHALDVNRLPQGIYVVKGFQEDQALFSKPLIINR